MEWVDVLAASGGIAGVTSIIWSAINIRSKKRIEVAKAEKEEAIADKAVSDNWQSYATKMEQFNDKLNKKVDELYRLINDEKSEKRDAQYHYCSKAECTERTPPLGTYKGNRNN